MDSSLFIVSKNGNTLDAPLSSWRCVLVWLFQRIWPTSVMPAHGQHVCRAVHPEFGRKLREVSARCGNGVQWRQSTKGAKVHWKSAHIDGLLCALVIAFSLDFKCNFTWLTVPAHSGESLEHNRFVLITNIFQQKRGRKIKNILLFVVDLLSIWCFFEWKYHL